MTNEAKKKGKRAEGVEGTWHFGNRHRGDSDDHLVASSVTFLWEAGGLERASPPSPWSCCVNAAGVLMSTGGAPGPAVALTREAAAVPKEPCASRDEYKEP